MVSNTARARQVWAWEADYHVNSPTGLTATPLNKIQEALVQRREDALRWFGDKPDVAVLVGDGIDGKDKKGWDTQGKTMMEQAREAAELMSMWHATKEYIIITGTRYHVDADGENLEYHIGMCLKDILHQRGEHDKIVSVKRKLKTTVNNWYMVESRHKVGRSSIFYSRNTAPGRAKMWNVLNSALSSSRSGGVAKWPNMLVFAHVHYYTYHKDAFGAAATLPCWQAIGSRYGDEECDGHIDIGMCKLEIGSTEEEGASWSERLYPAGVVDRLEHR